MYAGKRMVSIPKKVMGQYFDEFKKYSKVRDKLKAFQLNNKVVCNSDQIYFPFIFSWLSMLGMTSTTFFFVVEAIN